MERKYFLGQTRRPAASGKNSSMWKRGNTFVGPLKERALLEELDSLGKGGGMTHSEKKKRNGELVLQKGKTYHRRTGNTGSPMKQKEEEKVTPTTSVEEGGKTTTLPQTHPCVS